MPIPQQFLEESFQIEAPSGYENTVRRAIASLLPDAKFGKGRKISVEVKSKEQSICVTVELEGLEGKKSYVDTERFAEDEKRLRTRERIRAGVFAVISLAYNIPPSPWGTLVGVRPTKLVHALYDEGKSKEDIANFLSDIYQVSKEKIDLLFQVADKQREFFHPSPKGPISVYLGIPFCPTRCGYCSFAAYPLKSHGHLVADFFEALCCEIKEIGTLLKDLAVPVESIYLGGGTPTTIRGRNLEILLALVQEYFGESYKEFTVEAGRPETLTKNTVHILAQADVTRVSINPQTMRQKTLDRVGRSHTVGDVLVAFENCRSYGSFLINTDIILGLPGERVYDVEYTLTQLQPLKPDNLTVHSLAMKRAADWRQIFDELDLAQQEGAQMLALASQYASEWGMEPYYLYRQRYILSDLENIGFAPLGTESIYNIQMIEEKQSIIGLGGGAITKFIGGINGRRISRHANPKCPATYAKSIQEIIADKKSQLVKYFSV
ncbi:MAG: coproporphyrinogen dehydrogenase HemZ [Firmicutes bacterium]|nr:coproporphyrinogen dehydrogenase HemZ [Bacillota bacterium]